MGLRAVLPGSRPLPLATVMSSPSTARPDVDQFAKATLGDGEYGLVRQILASICRGAVDLELTAPKLRPDQRECSWNLFRGHYTTCRPAPRNDSRETDFFVRPISNPIRCVFFRDHNATLRDQPDFVGAWSVEAIIAYGKPAFMPKPAHRLFRAELR